MQLCVAFPQKRGTPLGMFGLGEERDALGEERDALDFVRFWGNTE